MFELMDRKIPAQLIVFSQFLVSNLKREDIKKVEEVISDISFSKPTKAFLKELGQQALI